LSEKRGTRAEQTLGRSFDPQFFLWRDVK